MNAEALRAELAMLYRDIDADLGAIRRILTHDRNIQDVDEAMSGVRDTLLDAYHERIAPLEREIELIEANAYRSTLNAFIRDYERRVL